MRTPTLVLVFTTRYERTELAVASQDGRLVINFPARPPEPCPAPPALLEGLRQTPTEVWAADDYIAVFEHEAIVRSLAPDGAKLQALDRRGVIPFTARIYYNIFSLNHTLVI